MYVYKVQKEMRKKDYARNANVKGKTSWKERRKGEKQIIRRMWVYDKGTKKGVYVVYGRKQDSLFVINSDKTTTGKQTNDENNADKQAKSQKRETKNKIIKVNNQHKKKGNHIVVYRTQVRDRWEKARRKI